MAAEVKQRTPGHIRVSRTNRVTIPVAAMAEAHLSPGDELVVEVLGNEVVRRPAADPWGALIGSAPGYSAETDLRAMRDEWDR
jgi:antitoxin component of MazEF toxin-antitoxin module